MKSIVKFTATYGNHVADDVAGFDAKTARELVDVKKVAVPHEPPRAETETVTLKVDSTEAVAEITRQVDAAKAELQQQADARTAELDAREAAVKQREDAVATVEQDQTTRAKDLDAREAALTEPETDEVKGKDETTSTKPPKQGGK